MPETQGRQGAQNAEGSKPAVHPVSFLDTMKSLLVPNTSRLDTWVRDQELRNELATVDGKQEQKTGTLDVNSLEEENIVKSPKCVLEICRSSSPFQLCLSFSFLLMGHFIFLYIF